MELLVPEPERGRRRADPRDRRRRVRRGARAAAGRRGRARGLRRPGHPLVPAGAPRRAFPRRAAAARRPPGHSRGPPLPHDVVGRPRHRRGDGPGCDRARLRVPGDLRPHRGGLGRAGARRGRRPAPGRGDRRGQRAPGAVPRPARDRVRHPRRRDARPSRRRARRAGLGDGERPRRAARKPRRADEAHGRGDVPPVRFGHQPPDRKADRPPRAERARPRHGLRRWRSRPAPRSRRTASPTGST